MTQDEAKRRPGRPRQHAEALSERVVAMLTRSEADAINALAEEEGVTTSALVRSILVRSLKRRGRP